MSALHLLPPRARETEHEMNSFGISRQTVAAHLLSLLVALGHQSTSIHCVPISSAPPATTVPLPAQGPRMLPPPVLATSPIWPNVTRANAAVLTELKLL